jgi:hypothetical protein
MRLFLTLHSHPGDYEDTDSYFMHCPEEAQPIVTFLGTVIEREGQLNNGPTLLHYHLQSTVYNSSTRTTHTFRITAYLKNGPRWVNFPSLTPNSQVFITGRIFGVTKADPHLAVLTDDIHFVPTIPQPLIPSPSSTVTRTNRAERWAQRPPPTTPSRPTRTLDPDSFSADQTDLLTPTTERHYPGQLTTDFDKDTDIASTETLDNAESYLQRDSPSPERRSKRPRKTSYADILA